MDLRGDKPTPPWATRGQVQTSHLLTPEHGCELSHSRDTSESCHITEWGKQDVEGLMWNNAWHTSRLRTQLREQKSPRIRDSFAVRGLKSTELHHVRD